MTREGSKTCCISISVVVLANHDCDLFRAMDGYNGNSCGRQFREQDGENFVPEYRDYVNKDFR